MVLSIMLVSVIVENICCPVPQIVQVINSVIIHITIYITVRLWDTVTHQCHVVYDGHSYPVWDVAFR